MLSRIFPKTLDNCFRGHVLALWLFVPLLAVEALIGGNSMLHARDVAMNADGIPLDSYSAAAANAAVSLFSLLGFFRFLFALLGAVAFIRYRAMVPLLYLLFLALQLGCKALAAVHPIASLGAASANIGSIITWSIIAALAMGFALSLLNGKREANIGTA